MQLRSDKFRSYIHDLHILNWQQCGRKSVMMKIWQELEWIYQQKVTQVRSKCKKGMKRSLRWTWEEREDWCHFVAMVAGSAWCCTQQRTNKMEINKGKDRENTKTGEDTLTCREILSVTGKILSSCSSIYVSALCIIPAEARALLLDIF